MSITLNTYGLRSVNAETFNTYGNTDAYIPRSMRDFATTLLRINNLVLNILGYIPGIKQISGCVRMGVGVCIMAFTLALGSPNADNGLIIGRWYKEALLTGIAQIARGALEAFVPFSVFINAPLDVIGTGLNMHTECSHCRYTGGWEDFEIQEREKHPPYRDPDYPLPFIPLHFI